MGSACVELRYLSAMGTSARVIRSGPRSKRDRGGPTYSTLASRPLHILVFLTPFMVAYEVGAVVYLSKETIGAHRIVVRLFESLGGVVWHVPTLLLASILAVWHLLLRDSWRIRPVVLLGMLFEACLWTLPILVLSLLENTLVSMGGMPAAGDASAIRGQPWQAKVTLSIGAGLYEEFLFRLILVTLFHFILADILRVGNRWGSAIAVLAAAVLFALYHDLRGSPHPGILFAFLTLAGAYFGALFLLRGFGIVVAVHAMYDVVVFVALSGRPS